MLRVILETDTLREREWKGALQMITNVSFKTDLREIGIDGANWIRLAQETVPWWAFVNTVMNLRVP
jgi:hypothetical protein